MPIWVHRLLGTVLQVAAFFGGAILGFGAAALILMGLVAVFGRPEGQPPEPDGWRSALGNCCVLLIGAPLFLGGAWLGRTLSYVLYARYVAARCSQCGGRTYLHAENAVRVRYRCRSCGHVHVGKSWEE
jgi:hypothetical protein